MELAEFVEQATEPGIGIYSARVRPTASGFHFEIELDGLNDPMGAVSLDECAGFSQAVAELIDEALATRAGNEDLKDGPLPEDLSEENYTMEVSSAGAERVLRLPEDLERFAGKPLRLRFSLEEKEYYERAVYIGAEGSPGAEGSTEAESGAGDGERTYLFKEYIERRKKKGSGGKGKESIFAPGNLRLRLDQIIKVNLFLDF